MDPRIIQTNIQSMLTPIHRKIYEHLIGTLRWDSTYTVNLFKYLRERIIDNLQSNRESMYMKINTNLDKKSKHVIVDNMMSDVLEKIIEDRSILNYDEKTGKFDDDNLKSIIAGIAEDATDRPDIESEESLKTERKGGKRSKNNKKKSKRKHQHNKKSHKKRR
jgi:hypothetical protein